MKLILTLLGVFLPSMAWGAEADLYCLTGTSATGTPIFQQASATNPCPVTATIAAGATFLAGARTAVVGSQFGLAVPTSTALTVPATATIANITVEGASIRYTSDGTTPTAAIGMGPFAIGTTLTFNLTTLAALRFIQTSASATIDVEYFK